MAQADAKLGTVSQLRSGHCRGIALDAQAEGAEEGVCTRANHDRVDGEWVRVGGKRDTNVEVNLADGTTGHPGRVRSVGIRAGGDGLVVNRGWDGDDAGSGTVLDGGVPIRSDQLVVGGVEVEVGGVPVRAGGGIRPGHDFDPHDVTDAKG